MEELEKLTQTMREDHKRERKKEIKVVSIVVTVLSIIYVAGISFYLWKYEQVHNLFELNGINDLFDLTKVYIHIIFVTILSILLMIGVSKGRYYHFGDYNKYKKQYKELICKKVLNDLFEDVELIYNKGLTEATVKNTSIVPMGERFSSEDYHKGKYKGVPFEASDVHTEHKVETEHSSGYVTDFLGQCYVFEFNKSFSGSLIVNEKKLVFNKQPENKLTMEDDEFNRLFTVSAEDKHLAYFILTPNFMNKLKDLTKEMKGHIALSFIDNKLNIAISNKNNIFECDPFKSIDEELNQVKKELSVVTQIIDTLDLDNDIFK